AVASIARPDVAVIVNVGVAHAEGVGGREGVMREKGAIYRALTEDGIAVVNADDAVVKRAAEGIRARARTTFGLADEADYRLTERASLGADGSRVTLLARGRSLAVRLPIAGEAAAIDLLAALAAQEGATGVRLSAEQID